MYGLMYCTMDILQFRSSVQYGDDSIISTDPLTHRWWDIEKQLGDSIIVLRRSAK